MAVDERARQALLRRLEELLGAEHAMTLVEHLPPGGWSAVATREDLAALELRLSLRLDGLDQRIDGLDQRIDGLTERIDLRTESVGDRLSARFHAELAAQTRTYMLATAGAILTTASLAFAAARVG
ncbi:MAG: hypothetical protein ACRDU8_07645 [Egibacteraceae bacterium]